VTEQATSFSDRQLAFINATSSLAEVEANLQGRSVTAAPPGAPDEIGQVCLWLGLPLLALGAIAFLATGSILGLLPAGPGLALLTVALVRMLVRARARRAPPGIELLTITPVFERRTEPDHEGVPVSITYVVARGAPRTNDDLVWPSKLHALGATLGPEERLRMAVVRRGGLCLVGWAHPL